MLQSSFLENTEDRCNSKGDLEKLLNKFTKVSPLLKSSPYKLLLQIRKCINLSANYLSSLDLSKDSIKLAQHSTFVLREVIVSSKTVINVMFRDYVPDFLELIIDPSISGWVKKMFLTLFISCLKRTSKDLLTGSSSEVLTYKRSKLLDELGSSGDYEFQFLIIQFLFLMFDANTLYKEAKDYFPKNETLCQQFFFIDKSNFLDSTKSFLNEVNRSSKNVTSIFVDQIYLENRSCENLKNRNGFWVNFNLKDRLMTWVCGENEEFDENEGVWLSVMLWKITSCQFKEKETCEIIFGIKEELICSCERIQKRLDGVVQLALVLSDQEDVQKLKDEILPKLLGNAIQTRGKLSDIPEEESSSASSNIEKFFDLTFSGLNSSAANISLNSSIMSTSLALEKGEKLDHIPTTDQILAKKLKPNLIISPSTPIQENSQPKQPPPKSPKKLSIYSKESEELLKLSDLETLRVRMELQPKILKKYSKFDPENSAKPQKKLDIASKKYKLSDSQKSKSLKIGKKKKRSKKEMYYTYKETEESNNTNFTKKSTIGPDSIKENIESNFQEIESKSQEIPKNPSDENDEDVFEKATQILSQKNSKDVNLEHIEQIVENKESCSDDVFDKLTQICNTEDKEKDKSDAHISKKDFTPCENKINLDKELVIVINKLRPDEIPLIQSPTDPKQEESLSETIKSGNKCFSEKSSFKSYRNKSVCSNITSISTKSRKKRVLYDPGDFSALEEDLERNKTICSENYTNKLEQICESDPKPKHIEVIVHVKNTENEIIETINPNFKDTSEDVKRVKSKTVLGNLDEIKVVDEVPSQKLTKENIIKFEQETVRNFFQNYHPGLQTNGKNDFDQIIKDKSKSLKSLHVSTISKESKFKRAKSKLEKPSLDDWYEKWRDDSRLKGALNSSISSSVKPKTNLSRIDDSSGSDWLETEKAKKKTKGARRVFPRTKKTSRKRNSAPRFILGEDKEKSPDLEEVLPEIKKSQTPPIKEIENLEIEPCREEKEIWEDMELVGFGPLEEEPVLNRNALLRDKINIISDVRLMPENIRDEGPSSPKKMKLSLEKDVIEENLEQHLKLIEEEQQQCSPSQDMQKLLDLFLAKTAQAFQLALRYFESERGCRDYEKIQSVVEITKNYINEKF